MSGQPLIIDIKRAAWDDGPGIRTTVFFKGCPLACVWCHNPEAISPAAELAVEDGRCIGVGCGACVDCCPASRPASAASCSGCGVCSGLCPTGARRLIGKAWPLDELCDLLLRDRHFYRASGGGVTLSGGEPTLHHPYVSALLQKLKSQGIHTAIQTCGHFDISTFRRHLLPYLDLIYFDLKLMDQTAHLDYTGVDNREILANFASLAGDNAARLVPRAPLVPRITATKENLAALAKFLTQSDINHCQLLPYNPGGIAKRRSLGQALHPGLSEIAMIREAEQSLADFFRQQLKAGRHHHHL